MDETNNPFARFDDTSGNPFAQFDKPVVNNELVRQLGLTGRAAAQGTAGLIGLVADPFADVTRRVINLALENKIPQTSFRGLIKSFLDDAGVPSPEGKIEEIVSAVSEAVVGGGGVLSIGKNLATKGSGFVTQEVGKMLAAAPATQLSATAAGEIASQGVNEAGGNALLQAGANILAGGLTTMGASKLGPATLPQNQAVANDIALGEQFNVPVLTSDIRPAETFASKTLETIRERVPIAGTGPVRVAQQEKRSSAIKDVLKEFGGGDTDTLTNKVLDNLLKTRSATIEKFSGVKNEIIDRLDDVVPTTGNVTGVPVNRTILTIDEEIVKLKSLKTDELAPAIAQLEDWRNAVQGQGIKNIEALRKQLGETFSSPDLVSVKGTTQKSLNKIYGAVRDDMGDFILQNGGKSDYKKWQASNQKLSGLIRELDKTALKTTLNKGGVTPEAVRGLLFSKKPSDLKILYKNLTPSGRKNAQAAILSEIVDKSTTSGVISPAKFISNFERNQPQFDVFFKGNDAVQVKGLKRILEITERASVSGVAPPTGVQNSIPILSVILTDLVGSMGAAFGSGALIGGGARLYESKAIRDAITHLSRTKSLTKGEAVAIKRLISATQSNPEIAENIGQLLGSLNKEDE
jgi:hypothetical protein|tara:strand:+ start:1298 stop:3199 length:1902 start_codon:yes stop_codon:yes gene_type:complete